MKSGFGASSVFLFSIVNIPCVRSPKKNQSCVPRQQIMEIVNIKLRYQHQSSVQNFSR
jgi:hypothetical protein